MAGGVAVEADGAGPGDEFAVGIRVVPVEGGEPGLAGVFRGEGGACRGDAFAEEGDGSVLEAQSDAVGGLLEDLADEDAAVLHRDGFRARRGGEGEEEDRAGPAGYLSIPAALVSCQALWDRASSAMAAGSWASSSSRAAWAVFRSAAA